MMKELNSNILGKLLLIQSTLHIMPDEEKIASFLSHGLSEIPGIDSCIVCFYGNSNLEQLQSPYSDLLFYTPECLKCKEIWQNSDKLNSIQCALESVEQISCIDIRTSTTLYGFLIISIRNPADFFRYKPYLENTANLIALIVENRVQQNKLQTHREELENEVINRTKELVTEIQERKSVEKKLRAREEEIVERNRFIETIINLTPAILYIYDIHLKKNIYNNNGFNKVLGYSNEEIQLMGDRFFSTLMHPDDFKKYRKETLPKYSTSKNKELLISQYRMLDKNQHWHWFDSTEIIFKRAPDGSPQQIFGVIHDITNRKKSEEDLIESEARVHQYEKMQAIGHLAGGVAHDFNNQLAGIVGYTDILRHEVADNSNLALYADNILLAAKRAADLTSQLLAFARKGKYLSVPIDLHKIINEVINLFRHTIDKRIIIKQHLDAQISLTKGDPSQIQNVIMNLALNARDAMPNGGELIFASCITQLDKAYCQNNPHRIEPGFYVQVCITDNGSGMDEKTKSRIFEPFFTTKAPGKGTGMGLAAVYGTVKNHSGAINVYSELNHGTTMKLYLPLIRKTKIENSEPETDNEPLKGTARILLVDDEDIVIDTASRMLTKCGYQLFCCRTGKEAVEYYKNNWKDIDLVILDMIMPELNGKDTFRQMKKYNPNVVALLSSGYSINGDAEQIIVEGVKGFIQKPYRQVEFSKKIVEILDDNLNN